MIFGPGAPAPSLTWPDYAILLVSLVVLVAIGVAFTRQQRDTADFFLARRRVPWWAACLSFLATEISAVTIISVPATAYSENWEYVQFFVGSSLAKLAVAFLFIPAFYRHDVTTIYEFLRALRARHPGDGLAVLLPHAPHRLGRPPDGHGHRGLAPRRLADRDDHRGDRRRVDRLHRDRRRLGHRVDERIPGAHVSRGRRAHARLRRLPGRRRSGRHRPVGGGGGPPAHRGLGPGARRAPTSGRGWPAIPTSCGWRC